MATSHPPSGIQKRADQSALLLMLGYVEAECRALGAEEAARHIAQAQSLLDALAQPEVNALLKASVLGRA
jgi:hypothetical protein